MGDLCSQKLVQQNFFKVSHPQKLEANPRLFQSLKTGHAPLFMQKLSNSLSEQPYRVCFQIFADKVSVN